MFHVGNRLGLISISMALLCGHAAAEVWKFDWTAFTNAGGTSAFTDGIPPYHTKFKVTGGNAGIAGATDLRFTACANMSVAIKGAYASSDVGAFDHAYYSINGLETVLATNASPGPIAATFDVAKGDIVAIGVFTQDGGFGPGVLDITSVDATATLGYDGFIWEAFDPTGTGSLTLPPPTLKIVGGNAGVPAKSVIRAKFLGTANVGFGGTYASLDTGAFDLSRLYHPDCQVCPPPILATNATQGPVGGDYNFFYFGWPIDLSPDRYLGFEVETTDGLFGPGTLTIDQFSAEIPAQGQVYLDLQFNDGGTGAFGTRGAPDSLHSFQLFGGDNGMAADTTWSAPAYHAACVQAEVEYVPTDIGCFDSAFYSVNGLKTTIACNTNPGTHLVQFDVAKGDVFAFGVHTTDGQFGAGKAIVRRLRLFPTVPAASVCYPDCDESGGLSIDDFICFQTLFALGDPAADCDASGTLSIDDFICFQTFFAIGC